MIRRACDRALKEAHSPKFKCFNCDEWFDGNEWRYTLSKAWYPSLKYKNNFLCGPDCSLQISEKYKEKYVGPSMNRKEI